MRLMIAAVSTVLLASSLVAQTQAPSGDVPQTQQPPKASPTSPAKEATPAPMNQSATSDASATATPSLEKFDASWIDKEKDPCDNFYEYACSKWNAAHPIPSDMPQMGTANPLYLWNQTILREALEKAAANSSATGTEKQIGEFWGGCTDMSRRNSEGKNWLNVHLKRIDGIKSKRDIAGAVAYLHTHFPAAWQPENNQTVAPLFGFGPTQDYANSSLVVAGIDQAGLSMPSRDYYLKTDEQQTKVRNAFLQYSQRMFELVGEPAQKAQADAKLILEMETALAKVQMENVKRREPEATYNKRTLAEIKKAVPSFGWDDYFKAVNAPVPQFYIVSTPDFLSAVEQQLQARSLDNWKTYLRWWAIKSSASSLGDEFVQTNFDFFGKTLSGTQQLLPLWRRCVNSADLYLGEALGQAYVDAAFPSGSKAKAIELVSDVRNALKGDVGELSWMSPATKQQALAKLDAIYQKIGYPDKWRDYSKVEVDRRNYLASINSAVEVEFQRQLNKIGKPIDKNEWSITPATIDAYYDVQMNSINFPAGILQYPFFNGEQDDAANYGGIGMIIGHEVIHGFDDQGRKFDAQGNLRDWWTPEDAKAYDERGACIANHYSGVDPQTGAERNGKLTQGEDTADNGGIRLAMMALEAKYKREGKSLDEPDASGLTPRQKFFANNAFGWCRNTRVEAERMQIQTNPHSLARYRVNNPMSNSPDFWKAFGCKPGQKMVHQPNCAIW